MKLGVSRPFLIASRSLAWCIVLVATFSLAGTAAAGGTTNPIDSADPTGTIETFTTAPSGTIDTTNPFFQPLGTNGRTCATCHIMASGWSVQLSDVTAAFTSSQGLDPLFAPVDGVDCPNFPMATLAQRTSNTFLVQTLGDFRIDLPIPANAQFTLASVVDPCQLNGVNFVSASHFSLFRRPLPTTNLSFLTGVMWDERNTIVPILPSNTAAANLAALHTDVDQTTITATLTHAQGTAPPTAAQIAAIDAFEFANFTAQVSSTAASNLNDLSATGGSVPLSQTSFSVGTNDPFGNNPTGAPFNDQAMTLYAPWSSLTGTGSVTKTRLSVARGENIFNTQTFNIFQVPGLTNVLGVTSIVGTCSTCHDTPNVGNHSISLMLNTGVSVLREPEGLPFYTLQNIATGQQIQTTDPGLAMITGQWNDIDKFKVPMLRGLAARAPYMHNGAATNLISVANFYNGRFLIGFTTQNEVDLANFLASL